jgi:hypothetical protein
MLFLMNVENAGDTFTETRNDQSPEEAAVPFTNELPELTDEDLAIF